MSKEYINPTSLFGSLKYGFSQIATSTSKRTIYLSGQTPFNTKEEVVGANRKEQMQQCLKNVKTALESVGGSLKDIVALRIYITYFCSELQP